MKARLAEIEETIYLEICSNQAKAKTEDQARQIVSNLYWRLQDWLADSDIDIEGVENGGVYSNFCFEDRAFCCSLFSTKLLLIWPFHEHHDAMFQRIGSC